MIFPPFLVLYSVLFLNPLLIQEISSTSLRLINGNKTEHGQFPWHTHLIMELSDGINRTCSGSLIGSKWVLTSAVCLNARSVTVENITAELGVDNKNNPEKVTVTSNHFITHPDYEPFELNSANNIALIELSSEVLFSDRIRPIALASNLLQAGTAANVSGFEFSFEHGQEDVLKYISLVTISDEECRKSFAHFQIGEVCCQRYGQSICFGDAGAPLIALNSDDEPIHVGIAVFGSLGCNPKIPSVFIRTAFYRDWIKKISGI